MSQATATEPEFVTSDVYEWVRQGNDEQYLIRTRMTLRNVTPGFQEVASIRRSEVVPTQADWAKGVAFANEVEAEADMAANYPWA